LQSFTTHVAALVSLPAIMKVFIFFSLFGAVAHGDTSCDGCIDNLSRELEKSGKDLSRCRANQRAIETRESILKEQVVSCEEQRKSVQQTSADLQSRLDSAMSQQAKDRENFQTERDALLHMVNTLKQSQQDLQEKYDTAVQEYRTATEKQQLRYAQQLELVLAQSNQLEHNLEEATDKQTSLEESNKSLRLVMERLTREKDDALANVDKWQSKFSENHSSCETSLATLQVQLEQTDLKREAQLADFQSFCESQKQAVDERLSSRVTELQATIDQLRTKHEHETKLLQEQHNDSLLEQQGTCESKVTALQELNQQLDTSMKSKLLEAEVTCTNHKETLQRTMAAEVDRALNQGIDIGKNKTSSGLLRLKYLNGKLRNSQRELIEQSYSDASRLQHVKDELFELRRELFLANEKLREPEIRHRIRMKRVKAVIDLLIEWFAPLHQAYVLPLLLPAQRYCLDFLAYFQREHLPGIQARAIYAMDSSRDLTNRSYDGILQGYNVLTKIDSKRIIDATARERKLFADACVRARTLLYDETFLPFYEQTLLPFYEQTLKPFYEQSLKPIIVEHWLPVYRMHVVPLWRSFVDAISPHMTAFEEMCRAAIRYHGVARDELAKKLYDFADVVSDYGHVQKYELIARLSERIRDASSDIVPWAETLILGSLAIAFLVMTLQRRKAKTKKQIT
jgi:hypothetical protein